jgi:ketosteroid isomerase-like protein
MNKSDIKAEKVKIEKTIRDCIEWPFPEKNIDRLYGSIANDPCFFVFHPDSKSTVTSFDDFDKMIKTVFMDDKLRPALTEIKDLRINLSRSGDVAWFSCLLDDCGEYNGRKWEWLNCRWTGLLQNTDGDWKLYQMHFSLPSDD